MCVIFYNRPGTLLPYNQFENATFNNPDGYGIILKGEKEFQVIKDLDEGGNDPEKIYKILEDNKDLEKYVHLRWKTEGGVTKENLHPFKVFDKDGHEIWFFHNGTLYKYKNPSTVRWENNKRIEEPDTDNGNSDTKNFAEKVLSPLLNRFHGDSGIGDYHDPVFRKVLDELWTTNNRGLLVSNKVDPLFFPFVDWKTITYKDGETEEKFQASNDDYFTTVKRGPEAERRRLLQQAKEDEERKKRQETASEVSSKKNSEVTQITSGFFNKTYSLSDEIIESFEDYDLFNSKEYSFLSELTYTELHTAVKGMGSHDIATLLLGISNAIKEMVEDNEKLSSKLDKSSKHIEELKSLNPTEAEKILKRDMKNAA